MNIHEHQGKDLLRKYGVAVLDGGVAFTPAEAKSAAEKLGGPVWVVKSQIHAGGRGAGHFKDDPERKNGGGVSVVKSLDDVEAHAKRMLNNTLVTKQTGPDGKEVKRIFVEDGCLIERELYLALLVDRGSSRVSVISSTEGGMDIEDVAHNTPEKIVTTVIDPVTGMMPHHARSICFSLGLTGGQVKSGSKLLMSIYKAFTELDCGMIEINPLVVTKDGDVVALDSKINFDESALYRHPEVMEMRDESEEDPLEREAAKHELNYVKLDGNIGCMVNGAGLAMGTMDIIKLYGAEPANFLDVGGGASKERVIEAFKLILSDPAVEGILINIFGGIVRCDVIAEAVVAAAKVVELDVPLVVRLAGTNVDKGKEILENSGLPIIAGSDLADAADKVVKAVKEAA